MLFAQTRLPKRKMATVFFLEMYKTTSPDKPMDEKSFGKSSMYNSIALYNLSTSIWREKKKMKQYAFY